MTLSPARKTLPAEDEEDQQQLDGSKSSSHTSLMLYILTDAIKKKIQERNALTKEINKMSKLPII